ncbi:hypothetical protein TorRG33x02_287520 [Trema orientale]|uniref:Uncharacterized protein n=1 Tax=Trema orientale TaxID=63057 RepID=A0A2P5CF40_TREOI|nr:hypothetical protein TorRG33x02_287520 [Trema orientale]
MQQFLEATAPTVKRETIVKMHLLAWGLRRVPVEAWSPNGVPILFGLGSEAAELVVMEELEIGEGVLHLVNGDKLERHIGVGEDVVGDEREEDDGRV